MLVQMTNGSKTRETGDNVKGERVVSRIEKKRNCLLCNVDVAAEKFTVLRDRKETVLLTSSSLSTVLFQTFSEEIRRCMRNPNFVTFFQDFQFYFSLPSNT